MEEWERDADPETLLLHGGYDPKEHNGALNPPIYRDIAPVQASVQKASEYFADAEAGFTYARKGHQNARILEKRLASVSGAEDALTFASGMAATNCVMLDLVSSGKHLVSQKSIYGGTYGLFKKDFPDAGRVVTFVENALDIGEWERAIRPGVTSALWVEMPSNPVVGLVDLEAIVRLGRAHNVPVVVDNTFNPFFFNPFRWGASLVVRSGSKYENLGSDGLIGFAIGSREILKPIRNGRYERYGAPPGIGESVNSEIGIRTLALRMERQSETAKKLAEYLERHRAVARVHYPALASSPYRDLAKKYMSKGCGAVFAVELTGGRQAAEKFMRSAKIFHHAINLGDVRSIMTYPWGTTHMKLTPEERLMAGINESLIRFSIGLENFFDLVAACEAAL